MLDFFSYFLTALAFKFQTVVELPQNSMFYLLMIFALCILVLCVCVLNKTKAMQVKYYSQKFLVKFLLGKRTANLVFLTLFFIVFYTLLLQGILLEIGKVLFFYIFGFLLVLNKIQIYFVLVLVLSLYLLFSSRKNKICKLLLYLLLLLAPRIFLISFFLVPAEEKLDMEKILLVLIFTVLVLILHYFARFLVGLGLIADYEHLVSKLVDENKIFLRFLVVAYLIVVFFGFFVTPMLSHYFVFFLLTALTINQEDPLKVLDKLVQIFLHPRSLISLICILQLTIFVYILSGKVLLVFFCNVPLTQVPYPEDMAPVVSLTILPDLSALSKFVGSFCGSSSIATKILMATPKAFNEIITPEQLSAANLHSSLWSLSSYVRFSHFNPIVEYTLSEVSIKNRSVFPFGKMQEVFPFSNIRTANDLSPESAKLIVQNHTQFDVLLFEELKKRLGVDAALLNSQWIGKKMVVDVAGVLFGENFDERIRWRLGVTSAEEGDRALQLFDANQFYHSKNNIINKKTALGNILRQVSWEGLFNTSRELEQVNGWVLTTPGDKFFVMRGPLGDFYVIVQKGSKYEIHIVECKDSAHLESNLGQVVRSMSHSVRVNEHEILIGKILYDLGVPSKNVSMHFDLVAARGIYIPQTLRELELLDQTEKIVRNILGATFDTHSLQRGSSGNLPIDNR